MIPKITKAILIMLLCNIFNANASSTSIETFESAQKIAKYYESKLSSIELSELTKAQGELLSVSLIGCVNKTGQIPSPFTLVLKMTNEGKVSKVWTNKHNAFLNCFKNEAMKKFIYKSKRKEFYSIMEVSL
jgi:hypothetical protein